MTLRSASQARLTLFWWQSKLLNEIIRNSSTSEEWEGVSGAGLLLERKGRHWNVPVGEDSTLHKHICRFLFTSTKIQNTFCFPWDQLEYTGPSINKPFFLPVIVAFNYCTKRDLLSTLPKTLYQLIPPPHPSIAILLHMESCMCSYRKDCTDWVRMSVYE